MRKGGVIAAFLAGVVGLALGAQPALADHPEVSLKPDLVTLNKGAIRMCQEAPSQVRKKDACKGDGRTMLRLASFVGNAGPGPLEYTPVPPYADIPADCHGDGDVDLDDDGVPDDNDVVVQQRVYLDTDLNGVFSRSVDTGYVESRIGCRYYHPEHDHYHVESFARFMLRNESTGSIERAGGKISFCVGDTGAFAEYLPGSPPGPYFSLEDCGNQRATQGISPGYYDLYGWNLSGQQIDITGMPAGTYCMIARADPDDRIDETNELNNDRLVRLAIDPADAPSSGWTSVPKQRGVCQPLR